MKLNETIVFTVQVLYANPTYLTYNCDLTIDNNTTRFSEVTNNKRFTFWHRFNEKFRIAKCKCAVSNNILDPIFNELTLEFVEFIEECWV